MTQLPECPVWTLPAKSLVHVGGMPYFTTAPTAVEGFGDPVDRLKPVPLTGEQSAKQCAAAEPPVPSPLFELRGPDGQLWHLYADGRCHGFPEGTMVVNHAIPLINQLQAGRSGLPVTSGDEVKPESPQIPGHTHPKALRPAGQTPRDEALQKSSGGTLRADHVAGIQLPSRRQIEHDLLVAMNHPLSIRRRTVTLLSRLRQYIERVEDRLMMSFTMPATDAASASPAADQEVSVETKWPNGCTVTTVFYRGQADDLIAVNGTLTARTRPQTAGEADLLSRHAAMSQEAGR